MHTSPYIRARPQKAHNKLKKLLDGGSRVSKASQFEEGFRSLAASLADLYEVPRLEWDQVRDIMRRVDVYQPTSNGDWVDCAENLILQALGVS